MKNPLRDIRDALSLIGIIICFGVAILYLATESSGDLKPLSEKEWCESQSFQLIGKLPAYCLQYLSAK